jgi:trimeric autotransporter adhesin
MKKLISCLPILFISNYLFAQPTNNLCTSPTSITPGAACVTTAGTLVAATYTAINHPCGSSSGNRNDVWYSFTAPATNPQITVAGTLANPRFQIYNNNCSSLTSVYCSVGGSEVVPGLTSGTTYLIRVYSDNNNSAAFTICIVAPATAGSAPANNACAGAVSLTPGTTCSATAGTLYYADATGSPANTYAPAPNAAHDVWYTFTTPANVTTVNIDFSALGNRISANGAYIEVFNATTCAGVTASNSIYTTRETNSGFTLLNAAASTTYYLRVFTPIAPTYSAAADWTFSICVTYSNTAPGNDNCAGATGLTTGTTSTVQTVAGATNSGIAVCTSGGDADDDVWYSFVANASYATVTVNPNAALGTAIPMVQVFSGACASLNSLGCGRESVTVTGLTSGTTYRVRVYSFNAKGTPTGGASSTAAIQSGALFNIIVTTTPVTTNVVAGRMNEVYQQTVISKEDILADPWEVTYGPDNFLWITEARGNKVYRMDPATGERKTILDVSQGSTFLPVGDRSFNMEFSHAVQGAQGGMAGLAIHPEFMTNPLKKFVYVSYVHSYVGGSTTAGIFFKNRVVRFTYNPTSGVLESPVSLCDTLPGSSDHNSQRMIIATVGTTNYLFYAAGDMGAGQFGNRDRPQKAQNIAAYEGKILRFNLESDGDAGLNAWIPNDNPYSATSAVWSIGIRNNQGFAYDTDLNLLYGSSHGPFSDDEINIIESGKNYGHPLVIGKTDGNVDGSTAGAAPGMNPPHPSTCPLIVSESANATALGPNYRDPIFSAYPNSIAVPSVSSLWSTTNGSNGAWPSEGWSGLDLYTHTLVPGWKKSLVAASLKWGRLVRIRMNAAGTGTAPANTVADTVSYFGSTNRFRDVAFSPNGKDIYVIMDRGTTSSGPSSGNPIVPACAGCLQKYSFLGYNDDGAGKSTIPTSIAVTTAATNFVCNAGTSVTIDNTNNNLWVPITGPDGNIMAEIKANGNNLGLVTSSFYQNAGAIRVRNTNRYLDRNITITPAAQPSSAVNIRLYLTAAEYNALDLDPLSGVSAVTDLKILKNNDACAAAVASNTTLINPTFALAHGVGGYMLQGDISSFSSFYIGSTNITLPLQLIYFTGTLKNNATLLNWETENEKNVSSFVVERGIDGHNFSVIGTVAAIGNTTTKSQYTYTDYDVTKQSSPVVYYRLRMVDMDGGFTYSQVVAISLADITGRVSVFPNPASQKVTVSINAPANGKVSWKLTDNTGRNVMQNTDMLRQGNNNLQIDVNRLPGGLYYLTVSGAGIDQKVKLQKL